MNVLYKAKASITEVVKVPLGFFVLSLLIIEGFLLIVLTKSGLDSQGKFIGMIVGACLFCLVVIIVALLVAFKSKNLMFGEEGHLKYEGKYPYGDKEHGKEEDLFTISQVREQPKVEVSEENKK